jgi:predicted phosphodiesterase
LKNRLKSAQGTHSKPNLPEETFTLKKMREKYEEPIIDEMINESKLPIIMITHHLPSFKLIHSDFLTDKYKNYNQCFASNCDQYFKDPIKIWIFGHTHKECDAEINNIKFLCNPVGYPDENNNQKTKIIEIYK